MNILITNDDGIDSPGLRILAEALAVEHYVQIIAPDGERSGMSHYLTMRDPIRLREVDGGFVISGSPADCVILGMLGAIEHKPDVVIAGINLGANLGTDVVYSGTAAAARQAAFMGVPGIAVSLADSRPPFNFLPLTTFISENLDTLVELWDSEHFININAPNSSEPELPVRLTRLSRRVYEDNLCDYTSPGGDTYFFLDGAPDKSGAVSGTDWDAVESGYISICPVTIHPVEHSKDEEYRNAAFLK